ncbi:MAG: tetratricopeptide repeat protein [Pseudomonadota bacterium]
MFSEELGVFRAAVETMLTTLKVREVPPEHLETKLKEIAERHLDLTAKLHELSRSNEEPEVAEKREQAAEVIEQGDYEQAEALLAEAVTIDRDRIDQQQDAIDRSKLSIAVTIAQQGELERTRLNYRKAAGHFAEAADRVQSFDSDAAVEYLSKQASVLNDQGREFGDNLALVEAIGIYRAVLDKQPRDSLPAKWAATQNDLGNALWTLGSRESGKARLEEAVSAYRDAFGGKAPRERALRLG